MRQRGFGFALVWLAVAGALHATMADAWVDALLTTHVRPDARLFGESAAVRKIIAAILAEVQAHHPGLSPLRISPIRTEIEMRKPRQVRLPNRDIVAAEVLLIVLGGTDTRIEVTDEELLLVSVDVTAEHWRARRQGWEKNLALMDAIVAGKADAVTLSQAGPACAAQVWLPIPPVSVAPTPEGNSLLCWCCNHPTRRRDLRLLSAMPHRQVSFMRVPDYSRWAGRLTHSPDWGRFRARSGRYRAISAGAKMLRRISTDLC